MNIYNVKKNYVTGDLKFSGNLNLNEKINLRGVLPSVKFTKNFSGLFKPLEWEWYVEGSKIPKSSCIVKLLENSLSDYYDRQAESRILRLLTPCNSFTPQGEDGDPEYCQNCGCWILDHENENGG